MKKLFTLIAAVSLIVACSEDITTNRPDGNRRNISFGVMGGDAVSVTIEDDNTRSTAMSVLSTDFAPWTAEQTILQPADMIEKVVEVETDFPTSEELCMTITDEPRIHKDEITRGSLQNMVDTRTLVFGVTEFVKDQTTSPVFSNKVPVVQNTTLDGGLELFLANETWEDNAYSGQEYDFYAYAPQVTTNGDKGITLSNNHRTISYNANNVKVGDQPDLMTARKATSAYVSLVPLTFQHRLCAIQIKTAGTWTTGYHVSGVKFLNVISSGTFDIDRDKNDLWTSKASPDEYVVTGFNPAAATGTVVTGPDEDPIDELHPVLIHKWLMLPPQTLSSAKISITLTDNDTETHSYTVTAPISAYTWTAGHTVTYTISPASIATMTVNYPTGWDNGGTPVAGPVTTYETADEFGLFVLDRDNNILVSNEPVSPNTTDLVNPAASRTLNIPASIFKSKQYKYYLMYPYIDDDALKTLVNTSGVSTYDTYYKKGGTGRTANADAFFTDVISNWTPANDQSDEDDFKAQDLQIGVLSGDQFDMVHKVGLVKIQLGTKTVPTTRTYRSDGASSSADPITGMKYTDSDGNQTVTASSQFDDSSKPLNSSGYYYIVNGSKTLKSVSTVNTDWEHELSGIVAGSYNAITIQDADIKRTCYKFTALFPYTGAVQEFPLPVKGTMTMQCWGASGATLPGGTGGPYAKASVPADRYSGGKGGYVSGTISSLGHYKTLYVYVGESGIIGPTAEHSFNGGGHNGNSQTATDNIHAISQGGGATDIRLARHTLGTWGGLETDGIMSVDASMSSRLIVAGGGAGAAQYCWYTGTGADANSHGGDAGGLIGYSGNRAQSDQYADIPTGGTQSSGGVSKNNGGFGYGGAFYGGGGGGYYGGGSGGGASGTICSGAGGSSYVSGHGGCTSLIYGGTTYTFSSPAIYDGLGYLWNSSAATTTQGFPNTEGSSNENGHSGNGYAKITMSTPDND